MKTEHAADKPNCKCVQQGYPEQDCKWHGAEAVKQLAAAQAEKVAMLGRWQKELEYLKSIKLTDAGESSLYVTEKIVKELSYGNDTTALDTVIAAAVKAENKRMMEFWQGEREIIERKATAARQPLVDALKQIDRVSTDQQWFRAHIIASDALAKVKEGK